MDTEPDIERATEAERPRKDWEKYELLKRADEARGLDPDTFCRNRRRDAEELGL